MMTMTTMESKKARKKRSPKKRERDKPPKKKLKIQTFFFKERKNF